MIDFNTIPKKTVKNFAVYLLVALFLVLPLGPSLLAIFVGIPLQILSQKESQKTFLLGVGLVIFTLLCQVLYFYQSSDLALLFPLYLLAVSYILGSLIYLVTINLYQYKTYDRLLLFLGAQFLIVLGMVTYYNSNIASNNEFFNSIVSSFNSIFESMGEQSALLTVDEIKVMLQVTILVFPSTTLLIGVINWALGSRRANRHSDTRKVQAQPINFFVPDNLVWLLIVTMAGIIITFLLPVSESSTGLISYGETILSLLFTAMVILFGYQGAGVFQHFLNRYVVEKRTHRSIWIMAIFLIILISPLLFVFPILGASEVWLKQRLKNFQEN